MADHPLRSATDRRLGRPLPHQLTNQTQAHPLPINLWHIQDVSVVRYEVLIPVSRGYPSAKGRLPTRYSPVRRFPLLTSTEASVKSFSLDLHVLGTPPAFILSQDQTLFEWYQSFPFRKRFNLVCLAHFTLLALCDLFRNLFVFFFGISGNVQVVFLLVRLPSISRKSLDSRSLDFYAMKFSWFLPFSGTVRFFSEHLLFYHLLSCLSATFLFFSVFLSSSSWPLSSDSLSILPNHSLSVNTFFETFLSFFLSPCFRI